jgi:hypothetical protein
MPQQNAVDRVAELLAKSGTAIGIQPPTALYNEGWMLRLLLDWFAGQENVTHPLAFEQGARWYSEALLTSQFLPRTRGDTLAESWTHADGVVGHFTIADGRGDICLNANARQLVVAEAKMFSPLSGGTKRASSFDQAARNVACIAEIIWRAKQQPSALSHVGFVVLAPASQIKAGVFGQLCEKESIASKVRDRVLAYETAKDHWHMEAFIPLLDRIAISLLSWEETIQFVEDREQETGAAFRRFYDRCLEFNGRATSAAGG